MNKKTSKLFKSQKEIVKILGEGGNETGKTCSREEIHFKQLWHSVVHIWVVNSRGEVLLQKRAKNKRQYADVWHVSAAGHIVAQETPEEAAIKEVREELGVSIRPEELIKITDRNVSQIIPEENVADKERIHVFLLKRDLNLNDLSLQSEELQKVKFYPLDLLRKDILDPEKSKEYLNHPKDYYLDILQKIKATFK